MSLEVISNMKNKRYIVTPGLIDLGEQQDKYNYEFGEYMYNRVDYVVLVGVNQTKMIHKALKENNFNMDNVFVVDTIYDAFNLVYSKANIDDIILLENDLPDAFNN